MLVRHMLEACLGLDWTKLLHSQYIIDRLECRAKMGKVLINPGTWISLNENGMNG
jgi:hypothetical protein